ncbi:MAG: sigma-70 family RNA polymerase sigma factor [Ginsengibacter sp.]
MRETELPITDDALLLQQLSLGSEKAFNALFEKYWEKAYVDAYKRLKNHEDSKDIVQEIFTRIWVNRQTQNIQNLPAYLHVAVRNWVFKFIAKQKPVHSFFNFLETFPAKNLQADSQLLWKEFAEAYETLLGTLPPKRQKIFRLHYHEGLPTKDISLQLRITRKTVQNQLGKAVDTLKVSLIRLFTISVLLLTMTAS